MKICAILPVRNEDWCLGLTLRALLMWVDEVCLIEHNCIDQTAAIVREVRKESGGRVLPWKAETEHWDEMNMRHELLTAARQSGATHIVILDADECLSGNLLPTIRDMVANIPGGRILQLPGYNLRGGIDRYHANGIWGNRWFHAAFQDDPRLGWTGDTYHQRKPQGAPLVDYTPIGQSGGGILHLWGASERRLHERHRFYRIQEALRWPKKDHAEIERMYSLAEHGDSSQPVYGTPATWRYSQVPPSWWEPYEHLMQHLHVDADPWQTAWCDEMIRIYGRERFAGLSV